MNWKKVGIYVLIYFVATAVAAFPFGFIIGFQASRGAQIPSWVFILQPITLWSVSIVVFARLAYILESKHLQTACCVGLLTWAVSYFPNVLLLKQPFMQWLVTLIPILITLLLGVLIGKKIQKKVPAQVAS